MNKVIEIVTLILSIAGLIVEVITNFTFICEEVIAKFKSENVLAGA